MRSRRGKRDKCQSDKRWFVLNVNRHPEVAAKRPSKGDGPGRTSFEARHSARTSG
jgi:hypothetical protein